MLIICTGAYICSELIDGSVLRRCHGGGCSRNVHEPTSPFQRRRSQLDEQIRHERRSSTLLNVLQYVIKSIVKFRYAKTRSTSSCRLSKERKIEKKEKGLSVVVVVILGP